MRDNRWLKEAGEIIGKTMTSSNQKIIDISKELIASVNARDGLLMQHKMEVLELAYKKEFPDCLDCYEDVFAYVLMNLASAKYFAYNNMYEQVHARYNEVEKRMGGFLKSERFNDEQKEEVKSLAAQIEVIHKAIPRIQSDKGQVPVTIHRLSLESLNQSSANSCKSL